MVHTCPVSSSSKESTLPGEPITGSLTFQHLMLIISCSFAALTLMSSLWLIIKHLHRYTCPPEQRQIIRMVFTPVVFGVLAAISVVSYSAAKYLTPLEDIYEAYAFAGLFLLLVHFAEPDESRRDQYFQQLDQKTRSGKIIPGGSYNWFNHRWIAVFQFPILITVLMTVEIISQAANFYCEYSMKPKYAHVWILVLQKISIIFAVGGVVRYYRRLKTEMAARRPLFKVLSYKLVIGITFFQSLIFSILAGQNILVGNSKVTSSDLVIGLPAFLTAIEAFIYSVFFHHAFRSREYHANERPGAKRVETFVAALDALNVTDLVKGMVRAVSLLAGGRKRQNASEGNFMGGNTSYNSDGSTGMEPLHVQKGGQKPY